MQAINIATPHPHAEGTEIGFGVLCLSYIILERKNGVNTIP